MNTETWKQLRRTALMCWGLGMASYLIIITGATVDVAVGLVSAAVAGLGAKFVE